MNKQFYIEVCLTVMVLLFSLPVFAQGNEPAPAPASESEEAVAEEPGVSASQEVEINEDNYRQFMELKDANRQRDMMPENVFKPETGLQKLDKLPEESQKHLRNELREIIVQGDPWQPGDEDAEYPYVPSAAALTDPSLQNQEKEAWGELVDSYNQREAQIYQNSAGNRSAMGSENGSGTKPGDGGQSGGESGEGSQGQQPGEENNPEQDTNAGTFSPNATNDPNAANTAGVSQNAMEFLQGLGKGGNGTGQDNQGTSTQSGGQGESPTPSDAQSEADAQSQAETGQQGGSEQQSSANNDTAKTARDPDVRSTAGASQNAMEFLKGNTGQDGDKGDSGSGSSASAEGQGESRQGENGDSQADGQQNGQGDSQENAQTDARDKGQADGQGDGKSDGQGEAQAEGQDEGQGQDREQTETAEKPASSVSPDNTAPISTLSPEEESTAGASQNALEYLTGQSVQAGDGSTDEPATGQQEGTLSIQDLLNAQGVGEPTGAAPASPNPDEEQKPGGNKADKDSGG